MVSSSSASSTFAIVAILFISFAPCRIIQRSPRNSGTLLLPRRPIQQTSREITFPGLAKSAAWNPSG
jgi:hypothetical protein